MAKASFSDERASVAVLSHVAIKCLSEPVVAEEDAIALNNAYRLLETFRVDPFFGNELPITGASEYPLGALKNKPTFRRHAGDVENALKTAVETAFQGASKEDAIEAVKSSLRALAYPAKFGELRQDQRTKCIEFFRVVANKLQPAY